jgi:hypothetical protein
VNIALWIVASVLAAVFGASGAAKVVQRRERIISSGYTWAEDYSAAQVKVIGVVEGAGSVGLVLPAAVGLFQVLTPMAAAGLAVVMVVAALVHVRRAETEDIGKPLVLGVVAATVAALRFGPYSF